MNIIHKLNELAKVPPTEMYTVSETILLKESLANLMAVVDAAKELVIFNQKTLKQYEGLYSIEESPYIKKIRLALEELESGDGEKARESLGEE